MEKKLNRFKVIIQVRVGEKDGQGKVMRNSRKSWKILENLGKYWSSNKDTSEYSFIPCNTLHKKILR